MKNETIKAGQNTIGFLLQAADDNKGTAAMFEFTVPAGAKVPVTYYHEYFDETIYGAERIITFTVEAKAVDISAGETCFVPRNVVHDVEKKMPKNNYLSQIKNIAVSSI